MFWLDYAAVDEPIAYWMIWWVLSSRSRTQTACLGKDGERDSRLLILTLTLILLRDCYFIVLFLSFSIPSRLPTHVVNTFCWIASTFTMPDAFNREVRYSRAHETGLIITSFGSPRDSVKEGKYLWFFLSQLLLQLTAKNSHSQCKCGHSTLDTQKPLRGPMQFNSSEYKLPIFRGGYFTLFAKSFIIIFSMIKCTQTHAVQPSLRGANQLFSYI